MRSRNVVNCFRTQSKVSLNLFTSIWRLDPITLFLITSHVFSMKSCEAMYISDSSWWKRARMPAPRSFRWTSKKLFNVECNIFCWNISNLPCTCVMQKTLSWSLSSSSSPPAQVSWVLYNSCTFYFQHCHIFKITLYGIGKMWTSKYYL